MYLITEELVQQYQADRRRQAAQHHRGGTKRAVEHVNRIRSHTSRMRQSAWHAIRGHRQGLIAHDRTMPASPPAAAGRGALG